MSHAKPTVELNLTVFFLFQNYNHDYYRNLTMAYYYVNDNSEIFPNITNVSTSSIATSAPSTTTNNPSLFSNDSIKSDTNDANLQERNELLVPQVEEDHLGAIDTVCVWLR